MAISLLKLCTTVGLKRPVSICRDVLGFEGSRVPGALVATRPQPELRLKRFADLLKGQHFHVHIIVAGSDLLTENDQSVLDYAVFVFVTSTPQPGLAWDASHAICAL